MNIQGGGRGEGCILTEGSFDYTDLHSCRIETGECAPVVDDETCPYHVGTAVYCTSLEISQFRI